MIAAQALKTLKSFCRDQRAVTAMEYSLIAVLIGLVVIVSGSTIGPIINGTLTDIADELAGAPAPAP